MKKAIQSSLVLGLSYLLVAMPRPAPAQESTEALLLEMEQLRQQLEDRKNELRDQIDRLNIELDDDEPLPPMAVDGAAEEELSNEGAVEEYVAEDYDLELPAPESQAKPSFAPTALTPQANIGEVDVDLGADLVSRYVWRGADFGNSASIQPFLALTLSSTNSGTLEIGAWSSWAVTAAGAGANENDLYISYSYANIGLTLTDYYFPESMGFFNYNNADGVHVLEASASVSEGPVSVMGAFNFWGDGQNSLYGEVGIQLHESEELSIGLAGGVGNGLYSSDTDPKLVNLSLSVAKGTYSTTYVLNPDAETTYLVFGKGF